LPGSFFPTVLAQLTSWPTKMAKKDFKEINEMKKSFTVQFLTSNKINRLQKKIIGKPKKKRKGKVKLFYMLVFCLLALAGARVRGGLITGLANARHATLSVQPTSGFLTLSNRQKDLRNLEAGA